MNRVYWFFYLLVRPFFYIIHPWKTIGRENIPKGGALVCANHTRNSDPLYITYAFGRDHVLNIMAKDELKKWPIIGPILAKTGLIFVKRGQSDIGAIKTALKYLKKEGQLLIFPEGTRHDETGEGKSGAVMIAIRSGVPIVPVYVPAKKKWFRRTSVTIGEPYYPFTEERRANSEDYRIATEVMMAHITALKEPSQ